MKSDLILILTLQRVVALYHMKQNSEAARGSTNCVCLLVRRLTINNYSSDVIRMWPEADNYHNLITEPEESEPRVRAPPLATPCPVSSGASLTTLHWRVITGSARLVQIQTNRGIWGQTWFYPLIKSPDEIKMIYWSWQISLELWLQVSFVMTHFNLMDNARWGILAEFVFSNLAFVSALVVNKTDTGFNNHSFLFIRKKVCL